MKACALLVLLVFAALALSAPATATTYPRTCGKATYRGESFVLRAHLISCSKGKPYALNYLRKRKKPKGWRCSNGKKQDSIRFICRKSKSSFLAIVR